MQLIAKKDFAYPPGRSVRKGDEFEAVNKDARLLIAVGYAERSQEVVSQPEREYVPVEEVFVPVKPKRRYRRRDMTAE